MSVLAMIKQLLCKHKLEFLDNVHFAPPSGHRCVCQRPLSVTSGQVLIRHFPFNHNDVVFRYPLEQRVG